MRGKKGGVSLRTSTREQKLQYDRVSVPQLIQPALFLLLFLIMTTDQASPDAPPHALLMEHSEAEHPRQMPDTSPKQAPGGSRGTEQPVELPGLADEPGVNATACNEEGLICDADGGETEADGDAQEGVSESDAGVECRVAPRHHLVSCRTVFTGDGGGQGVKMWELPGKEQCGEEPASRV